MCKNNFISILNNLKYVIYIEYIVINTLYICTHTHTHTYVNFITHMIFTSDTLCTASFTQVLIFFSVFIAKFTAKSFHPKKFELDLSFQACTKL